MRNLACVGAEPVGLTDCLNFGNPENPEISWQFREAIRGMSEACRALGVPVISGNVSFYNETEGRSIYPTPTVAMVGVIADAGEAAGRRLRPRRRPRGAPRPRPLRVRRRGLPAAAPRHRAGPAARGGPRRRAAARASCCGGWSRRGSLTHGARPLGRRLRDRLAEACIGGGIGARRSRCRRRRRTSSRRPRRGRSWPARRPRSTGAARRRGGGRAGGGDRRGGRRGAGGASRTARRSRRRWPTSTHLVDGAAGGARALAPTQRPAPIRPGALSSVTICRTRISPRP